MKKIINLVIICSLALFFLSVANVFAVDTTKLATKEYKITGVGKKYDNTGAYFGSGQITQGMLLFATPENGILAVHNIASDLYASILGGFPEMYLYIQLGPYTTGVDKVKSTECSATLYDPSHTSIIAYGPAPCTAQIVFNSNTTFTGKITIPDFWGADSSWVLSLTGKYVGKWGAVTSSGMSIPDALLKGVPDGLPELFPRK